MFQLKTLLKTNHHINKTVSVLSLNIFGAEHDVLPAILNEGGLENVVQLTVSVYHTSGNFKNTPSVIVLTSLVIFLLPMAY